MKFSEALTASPGVTSAAISLVAQNPRLLTSPPCFMPSSRSGRICLNFEPNTGNNGVHASASPLEAFAERAYLLGVAIENDYVGKAMLASGIPMGTIKAWCEDPAVSFEGKKQSLFDLLEDLDGRNCLTKSVGILSGK